MFLYVVLAMTALTDVPRGRPAAQPLAVPAITSLSPASAVVGTPGLTLTVIGSGFANNSKVRWQGSDRTTTYVSATELRATITAADLAMLGTPQVAVFTQGGNGGTSNAVAFTVGNPVPAISSFTPPAGPAGGATFTLQVHGSNFVAGSTVQWNGVSRQTLVESPNRVSITVQGSEVASIGSAQVRVVNPAPGGGASSPTTYSIQLEQPVITSFLFGHIIRHYMPTSQLDVTGTGFLSSSVVRWNGSPRTTTFVSSTKLRATLPLSDTEAATSAQVTVRTTLGTASQTSAARTVEIRNPSPSISRITTNGSTTPIHDGYDYWATVTGTGLGPWTLLYINDTLMTNVHASSPTELRVSRAWRHGTVTARVENPAPGGGSASTTVTIVAPPVSIASISPNVIQAGSRGAAIIVKGGSFVAGATVYVNGAPRTTILVSRTEVRATLPASDLSSPRISQVRVRNPDPGSTSSNELGISIVPP